MRPIRRGQSPQAADFVNYTDAKPFLVSRLGPYCSYCERRVPTNLAVEHIQPKALPANAELEGRWDNFLLGCVNCNSFKSNKNVVVSDVFLPDRDNTGAAFEYAADGSIKVSEVVPLIFQPLARSLLSLVGLDKPPLEELDENAKAVALDRVSQRMEVWGIAMEAKNDIELHPSIDAVRRLTVEAARGHGFFSIWMVVFAGDIDMRNRLIEAFLGTRGSGCFDPATTLSVSPAPNPDGLQHGGKL